MVLEGKLSVYALTIPWQQLMFPDDGHVCFMTGEGCMARASGPGVGFHTPGSRCVCLTDLPGSGFKANTSAVTKALHVVKARVWVRGLSSLDKVHCRSNNVFYFLECN